MENNSNYDLYTETVPDSDCIIVPLPDGTPHVLYRPTPIQRQFHLNSTPNLLAYGNRGGGKSIMLRMDAHMRAMSVPNCNLILVRRTYPELMRSHLIHIKQEMKLLGGDYHATDHIAYYPNGSKLFFSHVASEADSLNLLSAEFLAAYFDELSTIPWDFFVRLCASVRVTKGPNKANLIASVRAATNPLGPSAAEIFSYFVNKDVDPEEDGDYNPADWGSMKVQMEDNPHLDQDQYKKRFAGMPEYLKKAWLEGEFALENQLFNFRPTVEGKPYHVINEIPTIDGIPIIRGNEEDGWIQHPSVQLYRGFDLGFNPDPAYCVWVAHIGNRYIALKESLWLRTVASDISADMKYKSKDMRIAMTYCDPVMDIKTAADVRTIKDIFEENGVPMEPSINNREHYAHAVHAALNEEAAPGVPRLQILGKGAGPGLGCPYLIKTIPQQRYDPKHPLRMADSKTDHGVISLAYFLISSGAVERKNAGTGFKLPKWMQPRKGDRFVLGYESVSDRRKQ